jgi:hypothetical protein
MLAEKVYKKMGGDGSSDPLLALLRINTFLT